MKNIISVSFPKIFQLLVIHHLKDVQIY
jgi:hypothetical protein